MRIVWACVVAMALFSVIGLSQDTILINVDNSSRLTSIDAPFVGDFQFQAPVESYVLSNGVVVTDPNVDPLVGSNVQLIGTYSGLDTSDLSDVYVNCLMKIEQPSGASIAFNVELIPGGINSEFGTAAYGTYPRPHRGFSSVNATTPGLPISVQTVGSPSAALVNFGARVVTVGFSALVELRPASPGLRRLQSNTTFAPRPFEAFCHSNGVGDIYIGCANIKKPELFNIFTLTLSCGTTNPAGCYPGPLGYGHDGGITFDSLSAAILFLPMGVQPFHVAGNSREVYCFSMPAGTIPGPITVEYIAVQIDWALQEAEGSSPLQLTF